MTIDQIDDVIEEAFSYYDHIQSFAKITFENPNIYSPDTYEFIAECLNYDVQKRPTVKELMEFSFYKRHSVNFIHDRQEISDAITRILDNVELITGELILIKE